MAVDDASLIVGRTASTHAPHAWSIQENKQRSAVLGVLGGDTDRLRVHTDVGRKSEGSRAERRALM